MATKQVAGLNGEIITITDVGRRTFSKLKLYAAVKSLGLWADVKAWLEESDLWDAFVLAQNVAEDNEQFSAGVKTFKEMFSISDERVEEILASCVAEGAE